MLDDEVAILTEPTPSGLAEGILAALGDPSRAAALGRAARALAETKYSDDAYLAKTRQAMSRFGASPAPSPVGNAS